VDAPALAGPGAPLTLTLLLLGPVPDADGLLACLARAARDGLGPERVPHDLGPVWVDGARSGPVDPGSLRRGWDRPAPLGALLQAPPAAPTRVELAFPDPFCWAPRPQPAIGLGPDQLFDAALQRLRAVGRQLGAPTTEWWPRPGPALRVSERRLRLLQAERRSGRQDRAVPLWGVQGSVVVEGDLAPWAPLLAAAEVLGLGRRLTHGLGGLRLRWDP
jgi:hypothetical protein